MDTQRIEAAVRELLLAIGEDPEREGLQETPRRVAAMYTEVFSGLEEDPHAHVKIFHEDSPDEMVKVRDSCPSPGWRTSPIFPKTAG